MNRTIRELRSQDVGRNVMFQTPKSSAEFCPSKCRLLSALAFIVILQGIRSSSILAMASLAEMSSVTPHHWVSEFAPAKYQKPMSYFISSWMPSLSWQAGTASGPFPVATLIQSCTVMVIAVTILVWVLIILGARAMPIIQNLMLVIHVFVFQTIIIVLWVLASRNSSKIKDASVTVPRAMIGSYLLNGALGLVFISYIFMMTDVEATINDTTGYPHMYVSSPAVLAGGAAALNAIPTVLIFAGNLTFNLSTLRQAWAFARNKGLPFSSWIGNVNRKFHVPGNAVTVTFISTNVVSLMVTYTFSIGALLHRRIYHPELLLRSTPVELEGFDWAVVMFVGVRVIRTIGYVLRARKHYRDLVVLVKGWKTE
ncbi:hypothetical protein K469DRAFT_771576 [Zopfia rhizophila CBS 207.26]|uniref:Uncharacterized protein n=1 Tax=Zopfia rhizophila CBS 207.26 TaxID=1314779 RepID=A0A6A6EBN1_9PEZI|nr:hypothetical protein K469DRAFT_771576 [Zopfia rhizophila CBS 207.26]